MPIADLLGVRFDMQLLGKLTLSVAAVLLISWAYRFYSSRAQDRTQLSNRLAQPRNNPTAPETCSKCKMELKPCNKGTLEDSVEENQSKQSPQNTEEDTLRQERNDAVTTEEDLHKFKYCATAANSEERVPTAEEKDFTEDVSPSDIKDTFGTDDLKSGLTLPLPNADENHPVSPTGRRSPCIFRKLEGSVGVGRELRQNLDHQGTFSTFLSKAEIKVEDADLVLEKPGNQTVEVRGKIYDYYVESSSHSISNLRPTSSLGSPTYGQYKSSFMLESQPVELSSLKSNIMEIPRITSPEPSSMIMRDKALAAEMSEDPHFPIRPESKRPGRHRLLRKDSYITAASNSELQMPLHSSMASTTQISSPVSSSKDLQSCPVSPSASDKDTSYLSELLDEQNLETVAGAKFLNFSLENIGSSELESLAGKLDLGNCLQALCLAKKHGHAALRQAALRVMSDNYFAVLRDPDLYGRLKAGDREQIQKERMRGRRFLMVADMESPDWGRHLSQVSQSDSGKTSSGIYYYDDYKDTWHLQGHIPEEVLSKGCAMCTMDNYLFVAVGFQGRDRNAAPSRRVFCYNPITSIWSEISPMNEARPHCKLVALQGFVYAIGGECLSSVERYDPRSNRWTFIAPLPNETFAVAHRATACNGELFVTGGTLKYTLLRYSPKTNTWKQCLMVGTKERTTELVAVRNFLYRFDVSPSLGISVYRYHAVARLWYECCSKRLLYCPAFKCVTMDDIIYCVSRQFTMRFLADDVSPSFVAEDLKVLSAAKGILFPFVLSLPDKSALQTRV
ncbi:kelch domain-containing protein 7A [Chanos chanos]|uniref:Kelch domain-containing protein 7A n=1 Tax=Chanos chanos TaxID=29144 RepID=A0A6J2VR92_CHACN|nr:kelch domain-containing protein 7A-like [Chanos chanos]